MAKAARAEAESWTQQKLSCLAGPILNDAMAFEALSEGEPKVCLGESPKPISEWLRKLIQDQ
jgi:hypothetical protein